MALKELVFGTLAMPWVPENATDYNEWSRGEDFFGVFTHEGDRFGFVRTVDQKDHRQYVAGLLPQSFNAEEAEAKDALAKHFSSNDRQTIYVFDTPDEDSPQGVNAYFSYGARYCKPCIICSKELETVDSTSDHVAEQPYGGTNFSARGHYGSTVFDPDGRERLSINICDECLKLKAQQGLITHVQERQRVIDESVRTDWEPYTG